MRQNLIKYVICSFLSRIIQVTTHILEMDSDSTKYSAAVGDSIRVQIEKAHNFMRQYRDPESRELKKLSANQFMDVWSHYDKDGKFLSMFYNFHT